MTTLRFATCFGLTALGLLTLGAYQSSARADDAWASSSLHAHSSGGQNKDSDLVKTVREVTARYRDVRAAKADSYKLAFGCVSDDWGAMGMHFVNFDLVLDGQLDVTRPEIVIYEPQPNGRLRLIGADVMVGEEVYLAEIGHLESHKRDIEARLRQLKAVAQPMDRGDRRK